MPVPAVAVVAPLTGPGTAAGTVLLAEVNRIRSGTPWAADWQVFHEARGVAQAVVAGDFAAVVGHADPVVAEGAVEVYRQAGLTCVLPLLPGRPPAVSWAPDESRLARTLTESALALGATVLTVAYDDTQGGAAQAGTTGPARAAGLTEPAGRTGQLGLAGRARPAEQPGPAELPERTAIARPAEQPGPAELPERTAIARPAEQPGPAELPERTAIARPAEQPGPAELPGHTAIARPTEQPGPVGLPGHTAFARPAGLTGVAGRGGRGRSGGLVGEVVEEARAAGLAVCARAVGTDGWPSVPWSARPGVLALLAPQHRLPALLRALGRAGGADPGTWQAVLVVADCGLPSFDALAEAAGLPVWAVHPELCLVRRARSAVTSLTAALAEEPALRGARLAARVASRSGLLLGGGGGVLGEGRRVSRLDAVCPVRAAAREATPDGAPAHAH